jgi:hypothetical protein
MAFEQVSRFVQITLPRRGRTRRFDVPAASAEIVIDLSTWFEDDWNAGRKFTLVSDVALYAQTATTEGASTSATAETDLSDSSPAADDTQMGYIPAGSFVSFDPMPGMWNARTNPEKFLHLRGGAAGAVWIWVSSVETD